MTRRNDAVMIISKTDYDRLSGTRPDFKTHLSEGPDLNSLTLTRERSAMREVHL